MPNSDNTYGTFNKQTKIMSQPLDNSTVPTIFADTDQAKSFYFTDNALTVMDECCTTLQWALVADANGDNTQLKMTFDFGTKGGAIAPADDWAEQYNSRKTALINSNGWTQSKQLTITDSTDHLF